MLQSLGIEVGEESLRAGWVLRVVWCTALCGMGPVPTIEMGSRWVARNWKVKAALTHWGVKHEHVVMQDLREILRQ